MCLTNLAIQLRTLCGKLFLQCNFQSLCLLWCFRWKRQSRMIGRRVKSCLREINLQRPFVFNRFTIGTGFKTLGHLVSVFFYKGMHQISKNGKNKTKKNEGKQQIKILTLLKLKFYIQQKLFENWFLNFNKKLESLIFVYL